METGGEYTSYGSSSLSGMFPSLRGSNSCGFDAMSTAGLEMTLAMCPKYPDITNLTSRQRQYHNPTSRQIHLVPHCHLLPPSHLPYSLLKRCNIRIIGFNGNFGFIEKKNSTFLEDVLQKHGVDRSAVP